MNLYKHTKPESIELRKAKIAAHTAFDSLWKSGKITRGNAYKWLSEVLGLPPIETHIGKFDLQRCEQVLQVCEELVDTPSFFLDQQS